MREVEVRNVIEEMIKESGKTKYRVGKEYGIDITQYLGKDCRISTLIKIAKICGYEIVVSNGEEEIILED